MIGILVAGFLPIECLGFGWHIDADDSGLFRHYNCDNSREASVFYDYQDDDVWKMFFIDENEYSLADTAQLWIYAKCFGTKDEEESTYTHVIQNRWNGGSANIAFFKCYEVFHYDYYHWQMFEFDKTYLQSNSWNQIEIHDSDDWQCNNIAIGIDQTFGGTPDDPNAGLIEDFDTSWWWSGGAGIRPSDPTDNEGELMIKLELVDEQDNQQFFPEMERFNYWDDYYPFNGRFIPIDYSDDKVKWTVDLSQTDINNYGFARLYIYGYSWKVGNPPYYDAYLRLDVNNHDTYTFDPDEMWSYSRNVGHWNFIPIFPQSLQQGTNTFIISKVTDGSESYKRHNLAIIYFEEVDEDHSAWYYKTGGGYIGDYPDLRPDHCTGELGMYLMVYKENPDTDERVGGYELACAADFSTHGYCAFRHNCLPIHTGSLIVDGKAGMGGFNGLENHNWDDELIRDYDCTQQNPTVFEGLLASEGWNGNTCGDDVDLLIACGHGQPWELLLEENNFLANLNPPSYGVGDTSGKTTKHDITMAEEGYPETDHWGGWKDNNAYCWTGLSEDGLNYHADWVLFLACSVLRGVPSYGSDGDALDPTNPWQFMLYHGTHVLMGFATGFGGQAQELEDFAKQLVLNWCTNPKKTVIEGFDHAVRNKLPRNSGGSPFNRYMIYYKLGHFGDYLDPDGSVDFDFWYGRESHTDIRYQPDPDGMAIVP